MWLTDGQSTLITPFVQELTAKQVEQKLVSPSRHSEHFSCFSVLCSFLTVLFWPSVMYAVVCLLTSLGVLPVPSDLIRFRPYPHYWSTQDILLFCAQRETPWDIMLYWRNTHGILQMAFLWDDHRNFWFFKSFRVRVVSYWPYHCLSYLPIANRDFFPVVITFMRQLPFIGTVLSLPGIRTVRFLALDALTCLTDSAHIGRRQNFRVSDIRCIKLNSTHFLQNHSSRTNEQGTCMNEFNLSARLRSLMKEIFQRASIISSKLLLYSYYVCIP